MKKLIVVALAAFALGGGAAHADDPAAKVLNSAQVFDKDAQAFGSAIKSISSKVQNQIASGTLQMITGPSGQAIMMVGDVTLEAAKTIDASYAQAQEEMNCSAGNSVKPFQTSGCVVRIANKSMILGVTTLRDGTKTLVIASADALDDAFSGLSRVMNATAKATGRLRNPVGAFFVLAYHVSQASETVVNFALVDVIARTVSVLADEGTKIIDAPMSALYDTVTLQWQPATVKAVNLPESILNSIVNVPAKLFFGKKATDATLRTLSPLGHLINGSLGLDSSKVRQMANSK